MMALRRLCRPLASSLARITLGNNAASCAVPRYFSSKSPVPQAPSLADEYPPVNAPIAKGHVVEFRVKTTLKDGTVIQEEETDSPTMIKIGSQYVVDKLDKAMRGLSAGDTFTVKLTPADRGVEYLEELKVKFPVPKGYLDEQNVEEGDWMEYPMDKLFEYMMGDDTNQRDKELLQKMKEMQGFEQDSTIHGQVIKISKKRSDMDVVKVDFNVPFGNETFVLEGRIVNNYGDIPIDIDENFEKMESQSTQMMKNAFAENLDQYAINQESMNQMFRDAQAGDFQVPKEDKQLFNEFMQGLEKLRKKRKAKKLRKRAIKE